LDRFVILAHDWPAPHYDFMLEEADSLRTFRLSGEPCFDAVIAAEEIAAHRRAYLDYEGPISGGRGNVTRWDFGRYSILSQSGDGLTIRLSGRKIEGTARIHPAGSQLKVVFQARSHSLDSSR